MDGLLVAPSAAVVYAIASGVGIDIRGARFDQLEHSYVLRWSLRYPSVVEELADWMIIVDGILVQEEQSVRLDFLPRLSVLALEISYGSSMSRSSSRMLVRSLQVAFDMVMNGDKSEGRAAIILALMRAVRSLTSK